MKNLVFLIWVVSVLIVSALANYLDFISGYTQWSSIYYSKDVLGMSSLMYLLAVSFIGYLLYEG